MNWLVILYVYSCIFISVFGEIIQRKSKVLSRKRRYLTFPEGSSFSFAGCITIGMIGQPAPTTVPGTLAFGLNWAIAYELPNATETLGIYHKKHKPNKPTIQRRNRRELYKKLETIFENMGYNGKECILKTICETTQRLVPHGDNMIDEMFRTVFTFPSSKVLPTEPLEVSVYDSAHCLGKLVESCDMFKCSLSLVDLAQGYYNTPALDGDVRLSSFSLFGSQFS